MRIAGADKYAVWGGVLYTLAAPFIFSWLNVRIPSVWREVAPLLVGVGLAAVLCTGFGWVVGQRRLFWLVLFISVASLWGVILFTFCYDCTLYFSQPRLVDVAIGFIGSGYGWYALGVYSRAGLRPFCHGVVAVGRQVGAGLGRGGERLLCFGVLPTLALLSLAVAIGTFIVAFPVSQPPRLSSATFFYAFWGSHGLAALLGIVTALRYRRWRWLWVTVLALLSWLGTIAVVLLLSPWTGRW